MPEQGKLCVCPQCGKKYMLKEGFEAKSFSCKGCGATVWVAGKPPTPTPTTSRPAPSAAVAKKEGHGARTAAAGSRGTGRKSRGGGEGAGGVTQRGSRIRQKKKMSKGQLAMIVGLGVGGVIALIGNFASGTAPAAPEAGNPADAKPLAKTETPPAEKPALVVKAPEKQPAPVKPSAGEAPKEEPAAEGEAEPIPAEGEETPKPKLGGEGRKGEKAKSQYEPPATLSHLDSTPPELRKQIDGWIAMMFDTQAGRDSLDAKAKLAATGKPAFLPVLGAMAKIRDSIADTDSDEERLAESSLKLADECLREMDGYLEAHDKAPIRPGTEKNYIEYVLRMHYKRWMTELKDMETMPGPYDASKAYKDEEGEEEAGK